MSVLNVAGSDGLSRVACNTTSASGTSASSASTMSSTENACQALAPEYQPRNSAASSREPAGAGDPLAGAQPPHQAGAAALARAAASVLRSSIAIVIGPTPRGTGVMRAARCGGGVEVDVADEPVVGPVDPDVDHGRARA